MSDAVEGAGPDVTFVGGIAAEQETEGHSNLEDGTRSKAIAAVKAAMKGEGEKAAKEAKAAIDQDPLRPRDGVERDATGKFVSRAAAPLEGPGDEDTSAKEATELKRALTERKESAARQRQWQVQQQQFQSQLARERAQVEQERRAIAQERQRMEMLRKDPVRAIRENGWDPEDFILNIANDGTPEGQRARQDRELRDKIAEMENWKTEQERVRLEREQQFQKQKADAYRDRVEKEYLKVALDETRHPNVASLYKGQEALLIAQGDLIAEQYRHLTGKEATFEDIAEYLEERHDKWYKSRSGGQATTTNQGSGSVTQGRPTQGSATGRTLNPGQSGERRTLGTDLKDLDGDERLEAAREAVKHAFHAAGKR